MHELAICQGMLERVEAVAADRGARAVSRVVVRIGPLSGVEPSLLQSAFTLARAGTPAASAVLEIETAPVRVLCRACGAQSEAVANRLVCAACGGMRTRLISGDELRLVSLDLDLPEPGAVGTKEQAGPTHV